MRIQIFLSCGMLLATLAVLALILRLRMRTVRPGQALVITGGARRRRVVFTRTLVLPLLERADLLDLRTRALVIEPEPGERIHSSDGEELRFQATFYLRVNKTAEDVLRVAESLGCERASDPEALRDLLRPRLLSALRQAASRRTATELLDQQAAFRDDVLQAAGRELLGFQLEELAFDQLELTQARTGGPFR